MLRIQPIRYGVKYIAPVDPFAAYVVSQMRGDSIYNDETGKTWQILTGSPTVSAAVGNPSGSGDALYFNGSSSLGLPHTSDLNIQGIPSTIELWVYIPNAGGLPAHQIVSKLGWPFAGSTFVEGASPIGNSSNGWRFQAYNNFMDFQNLGGGANNNTSLSNGTWTHYEIGLTYGSPDRAYLFKNGVLVDTNTNPITGIDQAISMVMGGPVRNSKYLTGYVANFRMTVGVCRHTSDFTPDTVLPSL